MRPKLRWQQPVEDRAQRALTAHAGTAAIDLNNSAAYRQDISEVVLVSLTPQNNFAGMFQIGAEFAGPQLWWNEDALNQYKVTGDTAASLASTATTINFAQTYTTNTVFRIVNAPVNPNSDLGPDLTRQRLVKTNYINRVRFDANLDSEQILRTHQGYVPGIVDELGYQFQQRLAELLRLINNAMLYSYAQASGNPTNDFQTTNGVVAWLDGTANTNAVKISTAEAFNDNVLNTMITNIKKQGAVSKAVAVGDRLRQILGALYSDTIRREQSDRVRGFWMNIF